MTQTIKLENLRDLVSMGAVKTATILGQKGGYAVLANMGVQERILANKVGQVKMFATTDTAVKELARLGLSSFVVDISRYEKGLLRAPRTDVTDRAKRAAAALEHDTWFRAQVEEALEKEKQGTATWHGHDDVWAAVREAAGQGAGQAAEKSTGEVFPNWKSASPAEAAKARRFRTASQKPAVDLAARVVASPKKAAGPRGRK